MNRPADLRAGKPSQAIRPHLDDARFHLLNAEKSLARAAEYAASPRELNFAQSAMGFARRLRRAMPRNGAAA